MADSMSEIVPVPPPWHCKATVFNIMFWTSRSTAAQLPRVAYSPLEAASAFASPSRSGRAVGGISSIQILRYSESPVGPYEEMLLIPGAFEYPADGKGKMRKSPRITRIYVSQRQTCWNGRQNWNIPKHLARFEWSNLDDGSTHVKVFPHDTAQPYDASESVPSRVPFFQFTFKPLRYAPYFRMSTRWWEWVGINVTLAQPSLPEGHFANGELAGTSKWCRLVPYQYSRRACVGWADMEQAPQTGDSESRTDSLATFWPGLSRWVLAMKMEEADIIFQEGEFWEAPEVVP